MRTSIRHHLVVLLGIAIGITVPSRAGEREILSSIKLFFETDDLDQRQGETDFLPLLKVESYSGNGLIDN